MNNDATKLLDHALMPTRFAFTSSSHGQARILLSHYQVYQQLGITTK